MAWRRVLRGAAAPVQPPAMHRLYTVEKVFQGWPNSSITIDLIDLKLFKDFKMSVLFARYCQFEICYFYFFLVFLYLNIMFYNNFLCLSNAFKIGFLKSDA